MKKNSKSNNITKQKNNKQNTKRNTKRKNNKPKTNNQKMNSQDQIKRKRKTNKNKKIKWKKIIKITSIIIGSIFVILLLILSMWFFQMEKVNDTTFWTYKNSTQIYDENDEYVTSINEFGTSWVNLKDISTMYINAVLATEDNDFYKHFGVDIGAIFNAIINNLFGGTGGGSTITMQLAKLVYLQPTEEMVCAPIEKIESTEVENKESTDDPVKNEPTEIEICEEVLIDIRHTHPIKYKVQQMMYAILIDSKYSKDEILEYYMNIVYFGDGIYGVENASQYFFNHSSEKLSLAEASLLAGIPQRPNGNNPYKDPEVAKERQNSVIDLMILHEYISFEEGKKIKELPISEYMLEVPIDQNINIYSGYIDLIYREMKAEFGDDFDVAGSGAQVYTNLNTDIQKLTWETLNTDYYVDYYSDEMQAGVVVLDTKTGAVKAVGNGRNYNSTLGVNYALNYPRQPGSSAKPITAYGPAIEFLKWGTLHPLIDQPITYSNTDISVENYTEGYLGHTTMKYALSNSLNTTALFTFQQVAKEMGSKSIATFMNNLGISDSKNINESYAIGGWDYGTTPYEMAAAYATFGNQGIYNQPSAIKYINFPVGTKGYEKYGETYDFKTKSSKAMEPYTAFIMSDMLKSTNNGSLTYLYDVNDYNFSMKTGSSNYTEDNAKEISTDITKDHWTIGYTPEYTTAVWTGFPYEIESIEKNLGSSPTFSLQIFHSIMSGIITDDSKIDYEIPDDVEKYGEGGYAPKNSDDIIDDSELVEIITPTFTIQSDTVGVTLIWSYEGDNRQQAKWNIYIDGKKYATTTNTSISIPYTDFIGDDCKKNYSFSLELIDVIMDVPVTSAKKTGVWEPSPEKVPECKITSQNIIPNSSDIFSIPIKIFKFIF